MTSIPLGSNPGGLAYDSGKGQIFVSNTSNDSVAVLSDSTHKLVTNIPVTSTPGGLVYDPSNGDVYVGTKTLQAYFISVISDSSYSVVKTIEVGYDPHALAYDSARGEIYVANFGSGSISVISDSNNSVVKTINLSNPGGSAGPSAIAYDSKGELFVADSISGNVSVISDTTDSVVANVSVAAEPQAIAYDSGNGEVFVASGHAGQVDVISARTNSLVANLTGVNPSALTYDPAKSEMFVAGTSETAPYADQVSAVSDSTNRIVASLGVSSEPFFLAYDLGTSDIIAGYTGGIYLIPDSLQTISGTTTVTSSVVATSPSSTPTSTEASSSSSLYLDQPHATLTYGPVTCTVNQTGAATDPCSSIDECANGNPCFDSMSTDSMTLVEGPTGELLEGFSEINFNVTAAGPGQFQLSYILYFYTGACGIPLQGEDHWVLSGSGTTFTGQYTISTPCISWTAPVTLTLGGTGLTQGIPSSTSVSPTVSASLSSSAPTTPTPPPVTPGIGLSTVEIAGIIAGVLAVAGGLGWYYYGNSGGDGDGSSGKEGGTVDCTPPPVACGHATRTPITASCLVTASGPSVECTASGTATAHRIPMTACSLAPAPCAPPGPYGCAHATREVTPVCSLTPASGVSVSCPDSGTATAHRIPESPCSLATSVCAPPGTYGSSHATREVCTVDSLATVCGPSSSCSDTPTGRATRVPQTACSLTEVSGPSVICPSSGEGTAHREAQSVCCLPRATKCSQTGHATRCSCTICAACIPRAKMCSQTGRATRCSSPICASCMPRVTMCSQTGRATRCSCPICASCLLRAKTCSLTGHATRCSCPICAACVPKTHAPTACSAAGTAVRDPVTVTACQPFSHASCAPVTCGGAAHGTRTSVSCECFPAGCIARAQKGPCTGTATRTPQCVQGCSVPVVRGPSMGCPSTGRAVRCSTAICAKCVPVVQCTASGTATGHRIPATACSLAPASCSGASHATREICSTEQSFATVQQSGPSGSSTATRVQTVASCVPIVKGPAVSCSAATGTAVRCACSVSSLARATCTSQGTAHATRTTCSCLPSSCQPIAKVSQSGSGTSTATRTPCTPQGKIKVVKQPGCSSSSSSSCSSTAEDTPAACG